MVDRELESAAVQADIDRAVGGFVAGLTTERVYGSAAGVEVTARLSGELTEVCIDTEQYRRCGPTELGELIVLAVADAARCAAARREQLARAVRVTDQPVLDLVQDLIDDPVGATARLADGR